MNPTLARRAASALVLSTHRRRNAETVSRQKVAGGSTRHVLHERASPLVPTKDFHRLHAMSRRREMEPDVRGTSLAIDQRVPSSIKSKSLKEKSLVAKKHSVKNAAKATLASIG